MTKLAPYGIQFTLIEQKVARNFFLREAQGF
jgi:hypothetical protein